MDFDQMFETWRAQNTAPPFDFNRDALRQALEVEEAKVRRTMRTRRRLLWIAGVVGTGMTVWAGFWIAIAVTNGWPAIYALTSSVSLGLFAVAAGALWVSRGREPERNFGNTLQDELRRSLARVDDQLSVTRRWILPILAVVSLIVGTRLFVWTVTNSQDIPDAPGGIGWSWFRVLFVAWMVWAFYKALDQMRKAKPKMELRRRRLRELLAALNDRDC